MDRTKEELMEEKKKLSDNQMKMVNAGYIYPHRGKYEVVDIRGVTVYIADNYAEANRIARKFKLNVVDLNPKYLEELQYEWEKSKRLGDTDEEFEMYFYGRVLNGGMLTSEEVR